MRVFLDTNVLVSSFATRGLCADVMRHVMAEHQLVVGEVVLAELRTALRKKLKLPSAIVADVEHFLREFEVVAIPAAPADVPIRDPDDRWVLASAIEARVDLLVSGDEDLLALGDKSPVRIVDPRAYWNLFRANRPPKGAP